MFPETVTSPLLSVCRNMFLIIANVDSRIAHSNVEIAFNFVGCEVISTSALCVEFAASQG